MMLDGHIHIDGDKPNKALFLERVQQAGVAGGLVISQSPNCFHPGSKPGDTGSARKRLDGLFARTEGSPDLYPFFWIDPMEPSAGEQVEAACDYGVMGFKVICDHYYPYDDRPMAMFRNIAEKGRPILFHSGILWDGKFSSVYCRPANFEALIGIPGLKFALAHASWPWCDECIAVYGKIQNAQSSGQRQTAEMFIDVTPGTPEIYRRELLTKLFTVGYDVENNVVFGVDCLFDDYNADWAAHWSALDRGVYAELKLKGETVDKAFGGNLKRFVGVSNEKVAHRALTPTG